MEASSQLSDTNVYQKFKGDLLKKVNNEIKSVLPDMFNRKERNNLPKKTSKTSGG